MSAPSIPNLLSSLRASRGTGRSARGSRGRGGRGGTSAVSLDTIVQGTDTDAAVSRLSAVDAGYLNDPYASYFAQSPDGAPTRRLPIINRGTYTRTAALDTLVDSFLASSDGAPRQIVSLGAGTDTRPFRLFAQPGNQSLIYHEIDFESTCSKKLQTVQATPALRSILTDISTAGSSSWASRPATGGQYHCHGADLRTLSSSETPPVLSGLRSDVPTLLLSECCLCYLSASSASAVLTFFNIQIPDLATVIYEPIRPDDAFGQMMVSNLATRRIHMPTLDVYREPADQETRLHQAGFETVRHMTIEDIWETWVASDEKQRLDNLEGLDEVEEWKLLAAHYVVVWGSRGQGFEAWNGVGKKAKA